MRQLIKYIISIVYLPLLAFSIYLTIDNLWYLIPDIFFGIFLFLSITSTDDIQFTITRPRLHKKVFHEAGKYYILYDTNKKNYLLYRDFIFFREKVYIIYGPDIDDDRGNESPTNRLSRKIREKLDDIYSDKVTALRRKELIDKWDGYTSDQFKRDDKIGKII